MQGILKNLNFLSFWKHKWAMTWQNQQSECVHSEDSESSLCAQWVAKDPSFLHADSDDSDQTGRMPRLIWVYAGRTLTLLVFYVAAQMRT